MNDIQQKDHKSKKKSTITSMLLILLILIIFTISMQTGSSALPIDRIIVTLLGQGTPKEQLILFSFRFPRILIAVMTGMGLAVSGSILQTITHNPLADSGILGINAGAGLMITLAVTLGFLGSSVHILMLPLFAFFGASISIALLYLFSYKKDRGISPVRMLLVGIGLNAAIQAAMILFTIKMDPNQYQFISKWLAGDILGSNWYYIGALLPWMIILITYIYRRTSILDGFLLGDDLAISLGIDVPRRRRSLLILSAALAGASVAVSGGISFVGLLAPHIMKRLLGSRHDLHLLPSALGGGLLVLCADTIGRSLLPVDTIPAGTLVAILGAPYFLYLLSHE